MVRTFQNYRWIQKKKRRSFPHLNVSKQSLLMQVCIWRRTEEEAGGDWEEEQCFQTTAKKTKSVFGKICQFGKTQPWPNAAQHQAQVLDCKNLLWPLFFWSRDHSSCGAESLHMEIILNSCVRSSPFFFSTPFLSCGIALMLLSNNYSVSFALLTSDEVAFIPIIVVRSPFGLKTMFRAQPTEWARLITSILDDLSWASDACQIIDNRWTDFTQLEPADIWTNENGVLWVVIVDSIESLGDIVNKHVVCKLCFILRIISGRNIYGLMF